MDDFVEGGYVILSRKLLYSRAWKSCNHNQKAMLITSLLLANHQDRCWWDGKDNINVVRGSFITSRDKFAGITDTTPRKVRTFWNKMEKVGFLTIKTTNQYTSVNICNYDTYQDPKIYKRPSKRQGTDQVPTTNNNEKNDKNEYSGKFEDIWLKYPNKDGKKAAQNHFNASVATEQDWISINKALNNYLDHLDKNDWKCPKNGSTWFNNWQDWVKWEESSENESIYQEFKG